MFRQTLMAVALTVLALPAFADQIEITDPYVRVSTPMSRSGAAFMEIKNVTDLDDRLVSASSDVAARVELHTHKDLGDGKMQMLEVKEGFVIPAHGEHGLKRGGDHVMFMGLNHGLNQGDLVRVTLHFERAGNMTIEIPVDSKRGQGMGMKMDDNAVTHGKIEHGTITHGEPKMNKMESDM